MSRLNAIEILYLDCKPEIFGKCPLNKKNSKIMGILAKYEILKSQ